MTPVIDAVHCLPVNQLTPRDASLTVASSAQWDDGSARSGGLFAGIGASHAAAGLFTAFKERRLAKWFVGKRGVRACALW
jgi:hypothetical protein